MRAQLDDAHERGEPLAALWASEETIYGRFGYGVASFCGEISLAREHNSFAQPFEPQGTLRLIDADEALEAIPPVYEQIRREWPGMFSRSGLWWENREIADPEERRDGAGPKRWVAYEHDGSLEGYAVYRHKPGFEAGTTNAELRVLEALGTTPEALRDVWAYLLAIDWIATTKSSLLPPDHALFMLLATPRRARYRMGDGLWVRLLDVGAALSGRAYQGEESIVFEVADEFCPWNEGRWKLEGGRAARTKDEPDLRLPVQSLGSALLGGVSFASLRRAGRLAEVKDGAIARGDSLFRWDRHPWCPEIF
jgi:predicted acetyltransferase